MSVMTVGVPLSFYSLFVSFLASALGPPTDITANSAQPPPEEKAMKHYIEQLQAVADQAQRQSEGVLPTWSKDGRIQCDTPLTEQIEALMRSLPPAQRDRPWSMDELAVRLQGRYNARPSAADVGIALRKIGWTRSRDWFVDGAGRRVWQKL
jgi:hypothetical protein